MPDLKQQLTELIDAFATAKATGNQILTQSAAAGLVQFLEDCEITAKEVDADTEETDGGQS
jgi:hypothetical protein